MHKSPNNIVLTGTLAGISEWFGVDPTIVRVVYVLLSLFSAGFPGFLLYIVLAIVLPSGKKSNYRGYSKYGQERHYQDNSDYYNSYVKNNGKQRKQAEKIDDDDWSDF